MATSTARRIALFSIKPEYAQAIMDGSKQVEFRRTGLSSDVQHVVVYSTSPVQRIIGSFEVAGIDNERPEVLWERYAQVGGINRDAYDRYFAGCTSAYAIKVRRPSALDAPVLLADVRPGLRPPQSFQYLDDEAAGRLDRRLLSGRDAGQGPCPPATPVVTAPPGSARGSLLARVLGWTLRALR